MRGENGYWIEFVSNNVPCFVAFRKNKIIGIERNNVDKIFITLKD